MWLLRKPQNHTRRAYAISVCARKKRTQALTPLSAYMYAYYCYVLIYSVRWLCVLLSVSMVCNRTFDKRQSCSSYKQKKKYQETGSIARRPGLGCPSKIMTELGRWLNRKCMTTKQLPFKYMYMYMPWWKNTGTTLPCVQFFAVGHR